jgi:integrase
MSIRRHKSKGGATTYYVYLRVDGVDRYLGKAATKDDAKALERREREHVFQVRAGLRAPAIDIVFSELALPWADKRVETHRRGKDDRWRMRKHIEPFFGERSVGEIEVRDFRAFIERGRKQGVGPTTVQHCVRLLGRFLNELVMDGKLPSNPVFRLDRATRRLFRPPHDPRKTPHIRKKETIAAIYRALRGDVQVMFAIGVFAGLRTGEILGLRVEDIDLARRRIHVQRSFDAPTKDDEPRITPTNNTLLPVLRTWLDRLGRDEGLVFPPTGHGMFVISHRLRASLRSAQDTLGLPRLTWYQSTRHTFASHWVTDGRPIEKLRDILGHSTVQVTERYAHLTPDAFGRADYEAVSVELEPGDDPKGGDDNRTTMKPGGSKSGSQVSEITTGEVAEWPKAPDSKSGLGASPTWVRLPPSPLRSSTRRDARVAEGA